ncbi:MAG TPA: hypothetical protein VEZ11_17910 [Thermoanaerobaculia bacterium]|nr:hypothetical protein [Thermoanaerobaculia bacterium]
MDRLTADARETFTYLSNEYAQALQTFDALERQASTLMAVGNSEELRVFIDQFMRVATRLREHAIEHDEPHFAEWFGELIAAAEGLGQQAASER